ncbi:54S ribosomal protein RML2 mitochondrial [Spathaspora sp. JA1]|nr:54S ribosomal protein RML2 mitochondrial [Spathaspora sp. JA1]
MMLPWAKKCLADQTRIMSRSLTIQGFVRFNSTGASTSTTTTTTKTFSADHVDDFDLEAAHAKHKQQRELLAQRVVMKSFANGYVKPGSLHRRMPVHDHLHKGRPIKELTVPKKKTAGRNHSGKITVRGRGGGHKQRARLVDNHRLNPGIQKVIRIEYDPNRSGHIALIEHQETKNLSYILAPQGLRSGDFVESFRQGIPKDFLEDMKQTNNGEIDDALLSARILKRGNCLPLNMMPIGSIIHNIGLRPGGRGQLVRAAGTFAKLVSKVPEQNKCVISLTSGEERFVHIDCHATLGSVSNQERKLISWGKAGKSRHRGFRPQNRGVAMNANDHPHGGGRGKSKSNMAPRSIWGTLKFAKTRKGKNVNKYKIKDRRA